MRAQKYIVNIEAAIYNDGSYLLIVRGESEPHAPGTIALPGGTVEGTAMVEDIIESTLRREVLEETGVTLAEEVHYVRSNTFITDDGEPVANIVFLCRYASGELRASDPDEVADIFWMTPAEVDTDPRVPHWTRTNITIAEQVRMQHHW